MPPERKKEADGSAYEPGVPFTVEDARAILDQLKIAGVELPSRFVRPDGLPADLGSDPVPESMFPLFETWSAASREFQDALNVAAADAALFAELSASRGPRERDLRVLRNATSQILSRLKKPPPDMVAPNSKFDPFLAEVLSQSMAAVSDSEAITCVIDQVERLEEAIKDLLNKDRLSEDRQSHKRLVTLLEKYRRPPSDAKAKGRAQPYRIACYAEVFRTVLELRPSDHCNKTTDNYNGAFPDFIRQTLFIETGRPVGPQALTKALQRSGVLVE